MGSADDPRDEDDREEQAFDESVLPPGPRRSTYTPPTQPVTSIPPLETPGDYDDDDLAAAIEADTSRVATGAINVIYSLDDAPPPSAPPPSAAPPVATAPPGPTLPPMPPLVMDLPRADLPPAPDFDPPTANIDAPPPAFVPPVVEVPPVEVPPVDMPPVVEVPPVDVPPVDVPAVEPLQADPAPHDALAPSLAEQSAPAGRPWIPQRHSLPDSELSAMLERAVDHPGGAVGAMEEFEAQMKLRESEAQEYVDWQQSMLAVGTPEAILAVHELRPQFTDIVPPVELPPIVHSMPEPWAIADGTPVPDRYPDFDPAQPTSTFEPQATVPTQFVPEQSSDPMPLTTPFETFLPPAVEPATPVDLDSPVFIEPPDLAEPPVFTEPPELVEPPVDQIPVEPLAPFESVPPLVEPQPFANSPFFDSPLTGPATGSVPISVPQPDVEIDDQPDETDLAFDDLLGSEAIGAAPIEPIASPRTGANDVILGARKPERMRVFSLEQSGLEATPSEHRLGGAVRLFWMWFAVNSSVFSISFGSLVFSLGMSLRQAIVGILAGVALSFIPLGLGSLAGKRSGQPTMVVSRASFGLVGNVVPALLAVIGRVFWGAVLLWVLGEAIAEILIGAKLNAPLNHDQIALICVGGAFLLAIIASLFGFSLIAKIQLITTILSAIFIAGVIVLTWKYVDFAAALTVADGSWLLAITAAVIIFSFVGLVWANSSSDLARYQREGFSGARSMLGASFGKAVPTFVLVSYGALLAASNKNIAAGLAAHPFDTIGRLLPVWYPVPLITVSVLSLLCGIIVSIYSGGFALQAVGVRVPRRTSVILIGLMLLGVSFLITTFAADLVQLFRDFATTLAVPVAAWVGIFAAETMIRTRKYDSESLLKRGGAYPDVRWLNLVMLFVITGVGYGLTTATVLWLHWQGYLYILFGVPLDSDLANTDLGVFVALLLGLLVPIVTGIPAIRRQEAAAVAAVAGREAATPPAN